MKLTEVYEKNLSIGEEDSIDVDFDYYPEEPATEFYPGCPEEFEINNVWWSETHKPLSEEEIDKFEKKIIEALRDRRREF